MLNGPGGEPQHITLDVPSQVLESVRRGRMSVPLGLHPDLAVFGALPWCSVATLRTEKSDVDANELHRIVGPVLRHPDQWILPVLGARPHASVTLADYEAEANEIRRSLGLAPINLR